MVKLFVVVGLMIGLALIGATYLIDLLTRQTDEVVNSR